MSDSWTLKAAELLLGRKIVSVRYLSEKEAKAWMFSSRPVVLQLDDGLFLMPLQDDEANDGGALLTSDPEVDVLLTL